MNINEYHCNFNHFVGLLKQIDLFNTYLHSTFTIYDSIYSY